MGTFLVQKVLIGRFNTGDTEVVISAEHYRAMPLTREAGYDPINALISANGKSLQLESGGIEDCFCRVMFSYPVGHPVSWDEISDEKRGNPRTVPLLPKGEIISERQSIKDAKNRLNKKLAKHLMLSEYFTLDEGTYRRG